MKLEVEMTEEQLNLLILSTEIYGRILMNQPDLVADIIVEDRFFYDKMILRMTGDFMNGLKIEMR